MSTSNPSHPFCVSHSWRTKAHQKSGLCQCSYMGGTLLSCSSAETRCSWKVAGICSERCWLPAILQESTWAGQGTAQLGRAGHGKTGLFPELWNTHKVLLVSLEGLAVIPEQKEVSLYCLGLSAVREWVWAFFFWAVSRLEAQWKLSPRLEIKKGAKLNLAEWSSNA